MSELEVVHYVSQFNMFKTKLDFFFLALTSLIRNRQVAPGSTGRSLEFLSLWSRRITRSWSLKTRPLEQTSPSSLYQLLKRFVFPTLKASEWKNINFFNFCEDILTVFRPCSSCCRVSWRPARKDPFAATRSQGSDSSWRMEHTTWWIPTKSPSSVRGRVLSNKVRWARLSLTRPAVALSCNGWI